ncbi:MAG: hypothetical protein ACXVXP_09820, partial [Mycobacteriaceae bacterium]
MAAYCQWDGDIESARPGFCAEIGVARGVGVGVCGQFDAEQAAIAAPAGADAGAVCVIREGEFEVSAVHRLEAAGFVDNVTIGAAFAEPPA